MSLRIDTSELIPGALVIGNTGLGVRGDAVPSTGTHGASLLFNDITLPGEAADEFRSAITSWPAGLALFVYEDGSFTASGPDGVYAGSYEGFKNGASYGTAAFTITIGSEVVRSITASGIGSTAAFGAPSVSAGTQRAVSVAGIASTVAFGAPAVSRSGTAQVAGIGIASTAAFGAPTVMVASPLRSITVAGIASVARFGAARAVVTRPAGEDRTYPLAGRTQDYPLAGQQQTYPLG